MELSTQIRQLGFTYKTRAKKLEKLGIYTIEDLLYHIPFRYENYSVISPISVIQAGETVTIKGTVIDIKNEYTRRRFQLQKAQVLDETGLIECVWFNQPYITKTIHAGDLISIAGKADFSGRKLVLQVKEYEILPSKNSPQIHTGGLVPVYPETKGLSSKWIRNRVKEILDEIIPNLVEYLPSSILGEYHLLSLPDALLNVHFPKTLALVEKARERLAFDEFFFIQLAARMRKQKWEKEKVAQPFQITQYKEHIEEFWQTLPFELTSSQKKAVREIFEDVARQKPMNRLLEGDVGSGKTVVATVAMYLSHLNGFQSALMAPTEILATQHYNTISTLLSPLGVKTSLITGSSKKHRNNESGEFDILIGTHALLHEKIKFDKLGLVVIDEQQRFGVEQRAILREKGKNPHFLTMTATPIPRTVFLTMYGDLDLSMLHEMPKGRTPVRTWLVPEFKREAGYEWIKKQIVNSNLQQTISHKPLTKNQVFIICPFIEESESMTTVKAATKEYERLKTRVFSRFSVALLHGKMKAGEKQKILESFQKGEIDILVATPVVEVGIDIPNATIMFIEAAERFGLAQLHQLRGRVGRGRRESFCLLFSDSKNGTTESRLKLLERNHSGAELAEYDLKLRGPGDMYGTLQHGVPNLKVARFSDVPLIERTRKEAEKILPILHNHPLLQEKLKSTIIERVTPD